MNEWNERKEKHSHADNSSNLYTSYWIMPNALDCAYIWIALKLSRLRLILTTYQKLRCHYFGHKLLNYHCAGLRLNYIDFLQNCGATNHCCVTTIIAFLAKIYNCAFSRYSCACGYANAVLSVEDLYWVKFLRSAFWSKIHI